MAIVDATVLTLFSVGIVIIYLFGIVGWFLFNKTITGVLIMQAIAAAISILILPAVIS